MAGGTLKTKDWSAEDAAENFAGGGRKLTVKGMVEVPTTNSEPHLAKAVSPGINPTIRLLELSVTAEGVGGEAFTWKPVHYAEALEGDGFTQVEITMGGQNLATIDVQRIIN
ncbi:hypothetical protein [Methylobacterium sp.]|uniref:hypothetical protein n=1 Tax=Methylobacterium sp. TaxID=409 RepID=UPI000C650877|nr:hypothetical protein [Methylobacterium sp.]MBP33168.1 hypothetical protein [Methylobacterium sp.]